MEECLDVFNMDVGEEFGVREENDQIGESSTHLGKTQTYVHLANNGVHIKTIIVNKDNPQRPGDLR